MLFSKNAAKVSRFLHELDRYSISMNGPNDVEALREQVAVLVAERQALRACEGDRVLLEENRLEIARLQQRLAHALIARHSAAA